MRKNHLRTIVRVSTTLLRQEIIFFLFLAFPWPMLMARLSSFWIESVLMEMDSRAEQRRGDEGKTKLCHVTQSCNVHEGHKLTLEKSRCRKNSFKGIPTGKSAFLLINLCNFYFTFFKKDQTTKLVNS